MNNADTTLQGNHVYDLIGIGFGPSNLALALAIDEQCDQSELSALFLEQKPHFQWHPNMLIPGTEMQISFLKDLVTLRNPSSPYTFLNYLKSVGRLSTFSNLRSFYPSRLEFNGYLAWVAEHLQRYARYSQHVTSVRPCGSEPYTLFEVVSEHLVTGAVARFFARNLVIAPGGIPTVPFPLTSEPNSKRVWHSSAYLSKIAAFKADPAKPYRFSVIGKGQSAAEIMFDLHGSFPNATIDCVYRGFGLKPSDDSEFVNEIFDSNFVDFVHANPPDLQGDLMTQHYDTNYSVVDSDLIRRLYSIHYAEKVSGRQRLFFRNLSTVTEVNEAAPGEEHGVQIGYTVATAPEQQSLRVDAAILATGYTYPNPPKVLAELKEWIHMDAATGKAVVDRHYRMQTDTRLSAGIYVQGCNESTHGLSDTLLSILPIRSAEILTNLLTYRLLASSKAPHPDDLPAHAPIGCRQ